MSSHNGGASLIEEQVTELLKSRGLTISVAEACTAGMIATRLTSVAGSSSYFVGGVLAYANEVKERILGVAKEMMIRDGSVAEATALAMAWGVKKLLGTDLAARLRDLSLDIYEYGRGVADTCGIILADTKFEFGFDAAGELLLIDEVLTPDSSRFWPKESYAVGRGQPSLDKQPVRDWLDELQGWDKSPPAPDLPDAVVTAARDRYQDVFHRLTGIELADYQPPLFGTDR